jgi:hypothetical protein
VNLDTGEPARGAEYEPADEAYGELLLRLDERGFRDVSPTLKSNILEFYRARGAPFAGKNDDNWEEVVRALEKLEAKTDSAADPARSRRSPPRAPL